MSLLHTVNWPKTVAICLVPFVGFALGAWLDRKEDLRMTRFRDKSALYKRDPPPATPSWP